MFSKFTVTVLCVVFVYSGAQTTDNTKTDATTTKTTTTKGKALSSTTTPSKDNGQRTNNSPVTTPKPMRCMKGSCDGVTGACINKVENVTCTGVCTKLVTKVNKNETYSHFVVACATDQQTCAAYKAKHPETTCCESDLCNKYVADSAAPNTAVNIVVFAMVTGLLRKMLAVVANP